MIYSGKVILKTTFLRNSNFKKLL